MSRPSKFTRRLLIAASIVLIASIVILPGRLVSASFLPLGGSIDNINLIPAIFGADPASGAGTATVTPTATATATATPAATSAATAIPNLPFKETRQADRMFANYMQLRSDIYGVGGLFNQAAGYRRAYLKFIYSQQFAKRDTTMLEQNLKYFDTLIDQGQSWQQTALVDLGYPKGLNASGKQVVDLDVVDSETRAALSDFLTSRNFAAAAINALYSALNLYHQINGVVTPDIPKVHLPAYCLGC